MFQKKDNKLSSWSISLTLGVENLQLNSWWLMLISHLRSKESVLSTTSHGDLKRSLVVFQSALEQMEPWWTRPIQWSDTLPDLTATIQRIHWKPFTTTCTQWFMIQSSIASFRVSALMEKKNQMPFWHTLRRLTKPWQKQNLHSDQVNGWSVTVPRFTCAISSTEKFIVTSLPIQTLSSPLSRKKKLWPNAQNSNNSEKNSCKKTKNGSSSDKPKDKHSLHEQILWIFIPIYDK